MKSYLFIFTLALGIFLMSCENASQSVQAGVDSSQSSNSVVGAWKHVFYRATSPDGTIIERDTSDRNEIKLYTNTHFSYYVQSAEGELEFAGVGTYSYDGKSLIETNIYTNATSLIGVDLQLSVEWDGPDKFTQARVSTNSGRKYEVTFERIQQQ